MKKPVITLLTDFGTKDQYVASMKGVMLTINPHCTLVDISHQISPHDIQEGSFLLAGSYSYFPKGTIHLAVVDPGVGGQRKPALLVTENYFFVGPDNGLFTLVIQKEKVKKAIILSNRKYFLPKLSRTFHGRDLFAPAAAHLSRGVKPDAFGHQTHSLEEIKFVKPVLKGNQLTGKILHIDAFGNLVSNIGEEILFQYVQDHLFIIQIRKKTIHGLKNGYWEGKKGEPIGLLGSSGLLEISIKEGNAQKMLDVKRGDLITIKRE